MESMAYQIPEFGILALSMMLVIMTGGMNLSLTFSAALGMIIGGLVMSNLYTANHGALLAVTVGIATMRFIQRLGHCAFRRHADDRDARFVDTV